MNHCNSITTILVLVHVCYVCFSEQNITQGFTVDSFNLSEQQNASNYQIKREFKKFMRLQFIRNRIFNHLKLNKSLDYDDTNESTTNSTETTNDFTDIFSETDKFNQVIQLFNLTSLNNSTIKYHDIQNGDSYEIISRCLRGLSKIENITSLLTKQETPKELQLYFPLPPFFKQKTPQDSSDYNNVIKKATLKLYKKQTIVQPGSYLVSIYRFPIMSWMKVKSGEVETLLATQQVNHDYIGWLDFDLKNFYFGPHTYSKLVNSFIIVNGSDSLSNSIEMARIFTTTSCDADFDGNPIQPNQPLLELGGRDK